MLDETFKIAKCNGIHYRRFTLRKFLGKYRLTFGDVLFTGELVIAGCC